MSELPTVRPEPPAQPQPAGTRPALTAVDVLAFVAEIFAFVSLAIWGFLAWPFPWNIVAGIGAPLLAVLVWALFVSPRAVFVVHPFARALVELMVYAAATIAWWTAGQALIGIVYGVFAVTVGLLAGRRRLAA
ncbi:YrdB family protein [Microbacterium sp. W1N]|uniref:YrdB family protein n=1 Tax=Microbacterium festucae TaxID=2977531 RepID=UPI0021C0916B|nr:YrdB family protein [Microbacterium festucae]MCT9818856.1 YrdB family protein [Microbacterium festucae]